MFKELKNTKIESENTQTNSIKTKTITNTTITVTTTIKKYNAVNIITAQTGTKTYKAVIGLN